MRLFWICLFLIFLPFKNIQAQINQSNLKSGPFRLLGKISGYPDEIMAVLSIGERKDSTIIENGQLMFIGELLEDAVIAKLEIPVYNEKIEFWIEPRPILITARKDSLMFGKVDGSQTQDDQLEIDSLLRPGNDSLDSLIRLLPKDTTEVKYRQLINQINANLAASLERQFSFIYDHPNSKISAYYLRVMCKQMGSYKTQKLFDRFSETLKASEDGRRISEYLSINTSNNIGENIAPLTQFTISGKPIQILDSLSDVTLLDFWAAWCSPCRKQNQHLGTLYKKYHKQGFNIISITLDRNRKTWLKAIEEDKMIWLNVSEYENEPSKAELIFGISSLPSNLLVDRTGKILAKNITGISLENLIKAQIAGN